MTEAADAAHRAKTKIKPGRPHLRADGTITLSPTAMPHSDLASDAARETFLAELGPAPAVIAADLIALRGHYAEQNSRLADRMREIFAVEVREAELGGVRVHRVLPVEARASNTRRVLICLHGGAFAWGADSGALVEAIPIAARMGVEVVAVDYRMAPEHVFPAASEDVAAVYRALLERHDAACVGIYGCSAGAILSAQAVAWIHGSGLPRPGAIAMLCGGAGDLGGDSVYLAPILEGLEPAGGPLSLSSFPYFAGAAMDDPCVAPGDHPEMLARFPPTLLIAGGRDFAASSVTDLHLRLDSVGVDSRLYIFDGLWHAFHIFPDLPEANHVYRLVTQFFERTLAGRSRL